MASLYKAIVFAAAVLIAACTEKAADSNPAKTVAPPVTAMTEEQVAKLQREAQAGDSDAQYDLAYMYENGVGVPKNETKALELYQQAADQGHSAAQNNLDAMSSAK
ncbi:MAG: SEL1-like repeat protein [Methylobacter sp.]